MYINTTQGISIRVRPQFEPSHSNAENHYFVFSYHIELTNNSEDPVQLMRRHWTIRHADGFTDEVDGPGVVGEQPILYPGQSYQYASWCQLHTPFGEMSGYYLMYRLTDETYFDAKVPTFSLMLPALLN